jgi:transcriptional regulator with XRE-family HTH domain
MPKKNIELVPSESVAKRPPGPATDYFTQRLRELIETHGVRDRRSGRTKRLNCHALSELLRAQVSARGIRGLSQSQIYRMVAGSRSPTLDVLYEVAQVFDVSPRSLVPE